MQTFLDPKHLILGHNCTTSDNKQFILSLNLTRYIWITKWFQKSLNVKAFQYRFTSFIKLHKRLEDIMCFSDINIERLWIA